MSDAAIAVNAAESAPGTRQLSPARLSIAFVVVALTLLAARQALRLPGGQGIEDVLGWVRIDAVRAAVAQWCAGSAEAALGVVHLRWHIASLYLLVDNFLFMPLYAVLLLLLGRHLHEALDPAESNAGRILRPLLWWWTVLAVCALVLLDATENHGGFQRIGIPGLLFFASLLCGALLGWALWLWCTSGIAAMRTVAVRFAWAALAAGSMSRMRGVDTGATGRDRGAVRQAQGDQEEGHD